jgi:hypothetical protein
MFANYHGAITALREERMIGFALMFMLCRSITYVLVCIMRVQRSTAIATRIIRFEGVLESVSRGKIK